MNTISPTTTASSASLTRRHWLRRGAGLAAASAFAMSSAPRVFSADDAKGPAATKGRIKQSIAQWCFETFAEKWNIDQLCQVANRLGCRSVELVPPAQYPTLKKNGLVCALCSIDLNPDPPFVKGFNNPDHWPRVIKATLDAIDAAAAFGFPSVIAFTGFSARNPDDANSPHLSKEEGAQNCVEGFKKVMGHAEKNRVNLCLEMLNTRDTSHPMKGHPGYQGNNTEYCIDIIKRVGSPRLKLLFDIYHVQIMDGDVIRRLRQHKDYIGHVHTAGNPGRGELDEKQEISFRPIMQTLVDIGYTGYVGHEYIPTRDPNQSLREAVALCDV